MCVQGVCGWVGAGEKQRRGWVCMADAAIRRKQGSMPTVCRHSADKPASTAEDHSICNWPAPMQSALSPPARAFLWLPSLPSATDTLQYRSIHSGVRCPQFRVPKCPPSPPSLTAGYPWPARTAGSYHPRRPRPHPRRCDARPSETRPWRKEKAGPYNKQNHDFNKTSHCITVTRVSGSGMRS